MKHARSDYDAIQPWPTKRPHYAKVDGVKRLLNGFEPDEAARAEPIIPDDEPVLLIRGQDVMAVPTIEAWIRGATDVGVDPALVALVEQHRERIIAWQAEHGNKVPDAPADVLATDPSGRPGGGS